MNDNKNNGGKLLVRIIKWSAISLGVVLTLLVIGYAVVTSSWGIKTFILPVVADAAGESITAEEVDASLINSTVSVKKLVVGKADAPLLDAATISCSYDLGAILDGNIKISKIRLSGVKGSYTQIKKRDKPEEADKSKKSKKTPSEKKSPADPSETKDSGGVTIDLNDIKISDTDYKITIIESGNRRTIELKNTELSCERFANDYPAKVNISSAIRIDSGKELKIAGLFAGDCLVKVDKNWQLQKLELTDTGLSGLKGNIGKNKVRDMSLKISTDIDATGNSLKINRFSFVEKGVSRTPSKIDAVANIIFSPLKINAEIKEGVISPELVNSVSMFAAGMSPGKAAIIFSGKVLTTGSFVKSNINIKINRSGDVIYNDKTYPLPAGEFNANASLNYNTGSKQLDIGAFGINMISEGRKRIDIKLLAPYSWRDDRDSGKALKLFMSADDFNLEVVQFFLSPANGISLRGYLKAKLYATLTNSFKNASLNGAWVGKQLQVGIKGRKYPEISISNKINCSVSNMQDILIKENTIKIYDRSSLRGSVSLTGNYNLSKGLGQLALKCSKLDAGFAQRAAMTGMPDDKVESYIKPLGAIQANLVSNISLDMKNELAEVVNVDLKLQRSNSTLVAASVPSCKIDFRSPTRGLSGTKFSLAVNQLELSYLNTFIPAKSCRFLAGAVTLKGSGSTGKKFSDIKFDLDTELNKAHFKNKSGNFRNLNCKLKTAGSWSSTNGLLPTTLEIKLGQGSEWLLKMHGTGAYTLPEGPASLDLTCNNISGTLINFFKPGTIDQLDAGLIVKCTAEAGFKQYDYKGQIDLRRMRLYDSSKPVTGKINMDGLARNGTVDGKALVNLKLISPSEQIANLDVKYKWPMSGSAKTGYINVISPLLNVAELENSFTKEEVKQPAKTSHSSKKKASGKVKKKKTVELAFDFGERTVTADLELKKLLFKDGITGSLKGDFYLHKNIFKADPLKLTVNNATFDSKLSMVSQPSGIAYNVILKSEKFELAPFFKLADTPDIQSATGRIKSLSANIKGSSLNPPLLWDNLKGDVRLDLDNLSMPYSVTNTTMGNIFFIPINMLLKVDKLAPYFSRNSERKKSVDLVNDFMHSKYNIRFREGVVDLVSNNGQISIKECYAAGDMTGKVSFTGNMRLGTNPDLNIKSELDVYGVMMPVRIYGTPYKPKTDSAARITTRFLRVNAINMLDPKNIETIINKSSEGLNNILRGLNGKKEEETETQPESTDEKTEPAKDTNQRKKLEESVNKIIRLF